MATPRIDRLQALFEAIAGLPFDEAAGLAHRLCDDERMIEEALELWRIDHSQSSNAQSHTRTDRASQERMILLPGAQVDGFELLEPFSAGGTADVWRARAGQTALEARVALKIARAVGRAALEHERSVLESLGTQLAPRVLGAGALADGSRYLALSWIDGANWADAVAARGARERIELVLRLCDGVGAVHASGFCHGDLKPANVLADADGRVRIIDFGCARRTGSASEVAQRHGLAVTSDWSAPEQLAGATPSSASDVYTLARMADAALDDLGLMRELGSRGARELRALLARASSLDPAARPHDGASLAAELRSALARNEERLRRRTWIRVAGSIGLAALLAAALIEIAARRRESEHVEALEALVSALDSGSPQAREVLAQNSTPQATAALVALAQRCADRGDVRGALDHAQAAETALARRPSDSRSSHTTSLARVWLQLGKSRRALALLEQAGEETDPIESARREVLLGCAAVARGDLFGAAGRLQYIERLPITDPVRALGQRMALFARSESAVQQGASATFDVDVTQRPASNGDAVGGQIVAALGSQMLRAHHGLPVDGDAVAQVLQASSQAPSIEVLRWRALLHVVRGELQLAQADLERLGECGLDLRPQLALAQLAREEPSAPRAAELRQLARRAIRDAEADLGPDSARAVRWRADVLLSALLGWESTSDEDAATLERALHRTDNSAELRTRAQLLLARAALVEGNLVRARELSDCTTSDPVSAAVFAALRALSAQPQSRAAEVETAAQRTLALASDHDDVGRALAKWISGALRDCPSTPQLSEGVVVALEVLGDPLRPRHVRAVQGLVAIPESAMSCARDADGVFAVAIRSTSEALPNADDAELEFVAWLAQELIQRSAYTRVQELRDVIERSLAAASDDLLAVLAATAALRDSPSRQPEAWRQAWNELDERIRRTGLGELAQRLLLRLANRVRADAGEPAAQRWWELAARCGARD